MTTNLDKTRIVLEPNGGLLYPVKNSMASLAKVILCAITTYIITAASLPIDITNDEISIQKILNRQSIEVERDSSPNIFTRSRTPHHHINRSYAISGNLNDTVTKQEDLDTGDFKESVHTPSVDKIIQHNPRHTTGNIRSTLLLKRIEKLTEDHNDSVLEAGNSGLNSPETRAHAQANPDQKYAVSEMSKEYDLPRSDSIITDSNILRGHSNRYDRVKKSTSSIDGRASGTRNKERSGLMDPDTSVDDCSFEDDIKAIFNTGIPVSKTHLGGRLDEESSGLDEATQKMKISIDEVPLSRLPLMEGDIHKRDVNTELESNRHINVELDDDHVLSNTEKRHESEKTQSHEDNLKKTVFYESQHEDDSEVISTPEHKGHDFHLTVIPIAEVHHSQQKALSPGTLMSENVSEISTSDTEESNNILQNSPKESSIKSNRIEIDEPMIIQEAYKGISMIGGRPSNMHVASFLNGNGEQPIEENYSRTIHSVPIAHANTNTLHRDNKNSVVYTVDSMLENIFMDQQNEIPAGVTNQKIEHVTEIPNESLTTSETFIKSLVENCPKIRVSNDYEHKIMSTDRASSQMDHTSDITDFNKDKNGIMNNRETNSSYKNEIDDLSESFSLENIPIHENLDIPNEGDHHETEKKPMNINNVRKIRDKKNDEVSDDSPKNSEHSSNSMDKSTEAILTQFLSNEKLTGSESFNTGTRAIENPMIIANGEEPSESNADTVLKEENPYITEVSKGKLLGPDQNDDSNPDMNKDHSSNNYSGKTRRSDTMEEVYEKFDQKEEAPLELKIAKEEEVQEGENSSVSGITDNVESVSSETSVEYVKGASPSELNSSSEINLNEKEEINDLSEPPIEIQLAKEELHVRAKEERSDISLIENNIPRSERKLVTIPLLEVESERNWSCNPAEIDLYKDSFYHDELQEEFYSACGENDIFNNNANDFYDEISTDEDLITLDVSSNRDPGIIAQAVVPADNINISDLEASIDSASPTESPAVPVTPAPNLQGQNSPNYFRSLPDNLQHLFLRDSYRNSGGNAFNGRQRMSWRDIMRVLLRPNDPNQSVSRPQVPSRANQVAPIYPMNEFQRSPSRNSSSLNGGGPGFSNIQNSQFVNKVPQKANTINSNSPLSQSMNIGQQLNQVPTLYPGARIANARSTAADLPKPGLNQNMRSSPNGGQQPQDFNGGIFSRLGRGIGGLFAPFLNGQQTNNWFG